MRTLLILLVSVILCNCGETKKPVPKKETVVTIADNLKSTTIEGEEIILGVIRNPSNQYACKNTLRISIGTATQNEALITAFKTMDQ